MYYTYEHHVCELTIGDCMTCSVPFLRYLNSIWFVKQFLQVIINTGAMNRIISFDKVDILRVYGI